VLKDARAVYTPGISERAGTTSKFYHGDALGSTRGITNSSQTVTDAVLYDAFGMTVSRTGTTATPFGFVGAQGYQSDGDSGLQLLGHRYYDPSIGRFLSSDPAKADTNWYAYTENDPLDGTDPSGLISEREAKELQDLARRAGYPVNTDRHPKFQEPDGRWKYLPEPHTSNKDKDRDFYKRLKARFMREIRDNGGANARHWGPGDVGRGYSRYYDPPAEQPQGPDRSGDIDRRPGMNAGPGAGTIAAVLSIILTAARCGGSCFESDTRVLMADGSVKAICDLHRGDVVMSRNTQTGRNEPHGVLGIHHSTVEDVVSLGLANGDTIVTTEGHEMFVENRGRVPVRALAVDTARLVDAGGHVHRVSSKEVRHCPRHTVYNLMVEGTHTYFVGGTGILVGDMSRPAK
jgi:RHS repeat-associated protein